MIYLLRIDANKNNTIEKYEPWDMYYKILVEYLSYD